jgi:hypothetical protein
MLRMSSSASFELPACPLSVQLNALLIHPIYRLRLARLRSPVGRRLAATYIVIRGWYSYHFAPNSTCCCHVGKRWRTHCSRAIDSRLGSAKLAASRYATPAQVPQTRSDTMCTRDNAKVRSSIGNESDTRPATHWSADSGDNEGTVTDSVSFVDVTTSNSDSLMPFTYCDEHFSVRTWQISSSVISYLSRSTKRSTERTVI